MTIFLIVLVVALIFEYINGFHDAANAIATVVSTKVLTPRMAIMLAAAGNLIGAFLGTAVAKSIASGFVNTDIVTLYTIVAALVGGIIWNLITWWFGIPSSSSHALIGGLCGAALATTDMNWKVLIWDATDTISGKAIGLWPKLVKPMVTSPVLGFVVGFILMIVLTAIFLKARPSLMNRWFGRLQIVSAAGMAVSHGMADAQKVMGILTLALFTGTAAGAFANLPPMFDFLHTVKDSKGDIPVPMWVTIICAMTIAAGTAGGGWRIIKTLGHKMVKLQPVHGFAAEATASIILSGASQLGIPLSTTHVITTSIMGVGAAKRFGSVSWGLVSKIVWAWVITLPATALFGYMTFKLMKLAGFAG